MAEETGVPDRSHRERRLCPGPDQTPRVRRGVGGRLGEGPDGVWAENCPLSGQSARHPGSSTESARSPGKIRRAPRVHFTFPRRAVRRRRDPREVGAGRLTVGRRRRCVFDRRLLLGYMGANPRSTARPCAPARPRVSDAVPRNPNEEETPMPGRATSDLLLVGSLPADSTEAALRAGGELFGDLVFALPDGETGPRAAWVGYERERLVRPNPDVETVSETESPTGIPRHAYETPVFASARASTGCTGTRGRGSTTRSPPTRVPRAARRGRDPGGLRFQVGLPFPSSALNGFKADFASRLPDRRARASRTSSRASSSGCSGDPGRPTSRSSGMSATRCSTSRA